MDSMKSRLLTAAIGVPLALAAFVLGEYFHWTMHILISILCLLMVYELLSAGKLNNNISIFIPCAVYAFIQPVLIPFKFGFFSMYLFILIMFFIMIQNSGKVKYIDLCFSVLGVLVIVLGMSSILLLPPKYNDYYTFFLVFPIGVAWCADAGAYFTGVFFGKRKLCPKVSPNKTVEGFLGGIVVGTVSALIIGFIYSFVYSKAEFNYVLILLLGLLASIISVLGDLSFSLIKRSCKIKDFGSIFPGHGGFLDRFDSVIFAAPLIYFTGKYFAIFIL